MFAWQITLITLKALCQQAWGLRLDVKFVPCLYPCMSLSVSWLLTDCSELCWPTGGGGGWWGSDHWLSVTWSGLVWLVSSHQPAVLHSPHMATRRHTDGSRTPTNQSETSRRPADQWEPGWQVEARPDCDGGWPQPWHQKTASWWLAGQREAPATLLSPLNTFISHPSPLTDWGLETITEISHQLLTRNISSDFAK